MRTYYEADKVHNEIPYEPIPDEVRAIYLRPGELLSIQEQFPVAFQPLGTLEWHGRHNPLGVDSLKAEHLCLEAAKQAGGVVMPAIHFAADAYWDAGFGIGYGMDATAGYQLPGSFYAIDTALFAALLLNACRNYLNRGFKLVVLVSGHNPSIQQNVLDEVCYHCKSPDGFEPVCFTMDYLLMEADDPRRASDHAAGIETSMMLHLNKDRVNMEANAGHAREHLGIGGSMPYSDATAEEGELRFNLQVAGLVKFATERHQRLLGTI
ncbi:creatininase family protein [Paenibacillus lignilyticus]|uniref:Creatininase family protein n=1 Tax=Paenibacillus lignilyticus TaxID=1172615 RepID=A0ABS5CE10_9BACL|nr:creatininase family protein [Paenibacillus lignilyticus]MBP3963987.1 creatininase family protein [Paenibacillus lignilyticus]